MYFGVPEFLATLPPAKEKMGYKKSHRLCDALSDLTL
jgi:hypothetical protein